MLISKEVMSLVSPIIIVLACLFIYFGYRKGFLSQLLSIFSFVVIVIVAWNLSPWLAKSLNVIPIEWAPYQDTILAQFFYSYANQLVIFVMIVILAIVGIFVLKPIILLVGKMPLISTVNSLAGAVFGFVETALFLMVLLFVLHTPLVSNGEEVIQSTILNEVEQAQNKLFKAGEQWLKEADYGNELTQFDSEDFTAFLAQHGISEAMIQDFLKGIGK